jgi:hypothetical protein
VSNESTNEAASIEAVEREERARERRARDERWLGASLDGDPVAYGHLVDEWAPAAFDRAMHRGADERTASELTVTTFATLQNELNETDHSFGARVMGAVEREVPTRSRALGKAGRGAKRAGERLTRGTDAAALGADPGISAMLWDALDVLGDRARDVIDLHWRHGLAPDEIAAATGESVFRVDDILQKAPQGLNAALRTRLLWAGGKPDHDELAKDLKSNNVRNFDSTAVRVIHGHLRACSACRSRSLIALPAIEVFAGVPLVALPTEVERRLASTDWTPMGVGAPAPVDTTPAVDPNPSTDSPSAAPPVRRPPKAPANATAAELVQAHKARRRAGTLNQPGRPAEPEHGTRTAATAGTAAAAGAAAAAFLGAAPASAETVTEAPAEPTEAVPDTPMAAPEETSLLATGAPPAPVVDEPISAPETSPPAEPPPETEAPEVGGPEQAAATGAVDAPFTPDTPEPPAPTFEPAPAVASLAALRSVETPSVEPERATDFAGGRPAHEPVAGRTGPKGGGPPKWLVPAGIAAGAVLIIALLAVVFTGGGSDKVDTAGNVPEPTTTTTRARPSTTSTTRPPTTTSTTEAPTTSQTAPNTTAGGGGGGGGGGTPAPPPTPAPPIVAHVQSTMSPGTIREGEGPAQFSWSVSAAGPVTVTVTGPGVSSNELSSSVSVCGPSSSCAEPNTYYFTIVVKDSDGRQVGAGTAKLIVRD